MVAILKRFRLSLSLDWTVTYWNITRFVKRTSNSRDEVERHMHRERTKWREADLRNRLQRLVSFARPMVRVGFRATCYENSTDDTKTRVSHKVLSVGDRVYRNTIVQVQTSVRAERADEAGNAGTFSRDAFTRSRLHARRRRESGP